MITRNEKGSSLILVLLVSLIFMTLGLTIVAATIGGAKRTEIRKEDIATTYEAVKIMEEVIAKFHYEISQPSFKLNEAMLKDTRYKAQLATFIEDLQSQYNPSLKITNLSNEYDINPLEHFTRVYNIAVTATNADGRTRTASRRLFLSPTPSFLQYAAGSSPEGIVNLNGGSKIIGNMYGNTFNISNTVYFNDEVSQRNGQIENQAPSVYPSLQGELSVRGTINGNELLSDPSLSNYFFKSNISSENGVPIIKRATSEYVDVNFKKTFAQKINQLQGYSGTPTTEDNFNDENSINFAIKSLLEPCREIIINSNEDSISGTNNCDSPLYLIEKDENYLDINSAIQPKYTTVVYADISLDEAENDFEIRSPNHVENAPLFVTNNLDIEDAWLVVHGDLVIDSSLQSTIEINGNILVTGDLIIRGDNLTPDGKEELQEDDEVQFASTIYTLGKAEVYNTKISGLNNKQLVLLAQQDMIITRINEFRDYTNPANTPLEAYFYTDSSATLYGVGSLFNIKGGLFAKESLTINAIRQNSIQKSYNLAPNIISSAAQKSQYSRFIIDYDRSVIIDQLDALPRVDRLQLILDDMMIQ
ncbi:hypothetical protein PY093_08480 [Cytobacillus sp. S13-E01]|uniref:hypothetical protein n=1 Tax=Cytobacillus sp. S13-E01 TaxID=3031326 RepID=UPI0023D7F088|nr:hypothetical protein [Cytobacillus sp. S13-E01]MDF0726751.1 hypothetical protein [Cytobacillus sp. S13-E01]